MPTRFNRILTLLFFNKKQVKEKCLDLQSHIVSLETLVGDVVEFANTTNANLKAAECGLPRAVPPKSNAAVQTASATQAERDEKLTKAQREIARLTKELIDSQKVYIAPNALTDLLSYNRCFVSIVKTRTWWIGPSNQMLILQS